LHNCIVAIKIHFFIDSKPFRFYYQEVLVRIAHIRLPIAAGCTFLLTGLLCLCAGGCGSSGSFQSRPVEVALSEDGTGSSGRQGQGAAQSGAPGDKTRAGRADKSVLRPNNEVPQGDAYSLYRRREGDADLSALLTDDYLKQFDIPIVLNDAVQYFVRYYTTERRNVFANWLRRSRRYVPMIREIMRRHGLPEDLIYLAMIESGFNPKAYSAMKACGPWQFIYETGGRYGLRVNHWVDERRDPEKSTMAAALYLKDLFNQFGSWYLAAAAYNAGEKRIERSVEMHETSDFWELTKYNTLPRETREYIPRLIAAALVAKNPEKFGFTGIDYDQPIRSVSEGVPGGVPLDLLARAAWTDIDSLRVLNPELLTNITPPDVETYTMRLPETTAADRFREALRASLKTEKRVREATTYTFKKRDRLAAVLDRYNVGYDDLMLVNACDREIKAKAGAVLYIPRFYGGRGTMEAARETAGREVAAAQPEPQTQPLMQPAPQAQPEPQAQPSVQPEPQAQPSVQPEPQAQPSVRPEVIKVAAVSESKSGYDSAVEAESLAHIRARYAIEPAVLKETRELKRGRTRPDVRPDLKKRHASSGNGAEAASYHAVKKGRAKSRAGITKGAGHNKKKKARPARVKA
jgi:membrane-bound lytic murein transglycosylase D